MIVAGGAYAWFNRVEIREMVMGTEQVADVPAVSFEEVNRSTDDTDLRNTDDNEPELKDTTLEPVKEPVPEPVEEADVEAVVDDELPAELNLAVPWTPQAPFANWDDVHEDACEEISIYMVHLFYSGVPAGLVDPAAAEAVLLDMVDAEVDLLGIWADTTAAETAEFAESYYGYETELIVNPTVNQIKEQLVMGYPVIVPMAGQVLMNPFFTPPGPDYHMLVVKGYTADGFITNDPGTRRGENWVYGFDHFMNSMHDWNGGNVLEGQKVVIILKP